MKLNNLKIALKKSWSKKTSYIPDTWNPLHPALGQCAITALLVHDYLGGTILWAEAVYPDGQKVSHYFNNINNIEIDLTKEQFPKGTTISKGVEKKKGFSNTREFMSSDANTQKRYKLLKSEVIKNLSIT